MSLAQIGEFAFVLLSRASNLHLIEVRNKNASVITLMLSYMLAYIFQTVCGHIIAFT